MERRSTAATALPASGDRGWPVGTQAGGARTAEFRLANWADCSGERRARVVDARCRVCGGSGVEGAGSAAEIGELQLPWGDGAGADSRQAVLQDWRGGAPGRGGALCVAVLGERVPCPQARQEHQGAAPVPPPRSELALQIKTLLHEQGFTIAGAKKKLKSEHDGKRAQTALPLAAGRDRELLDRVRAELAAITAILERKH